MSKRQENKNYERTDKTSKTTNIIMGNVLIEEVSDLDYLGSLIIRNNGYGIKKKTRNDNKNFKNINKLWKGTDETTKL